MVKRGVDFDPSWSLNSSGDGGATTTRKGKRILKQPPISQTNFSELNQSLEEVKSVFFVFGMHSLFVLSNRW